MSDHAEIIREALMWAQAYVPDRVCHRLLDAEESLRGLLADHAAETERLRRDLRAEQRTVSTAADDLREARAENERHRDALRDARAELHALMRPRRRACVCDSFKGLSCDVAGEDCAALAAAQEPPADGGDRG